MTKFFRILIILSIIYPLIVTLHSILSGAMPFGYDPARDLLSAQENLKKLTLIGPPGGIPGIFYGPYWIWLLSIGLIFSRDPRYISVFVLVIPYFILFIGLLLKLAKIIGKRNCILLWLLFFFSYPDYINDLWHPHLAPIIFDNFNNKPINKIKYGITRTNIAIKRGSRENINPTLRSQIQYGP